MLSTSTALQRRMTVDEWAIGILAMPVADWIDHALTHGSVPDASPRWFEPDGLSRFGADPMIFRAGGETFVAYELYNRWRALGEIAVGRLRDGTVEHLGVVLGDPGAHFAFPFIVEVAGSLICVPDSNRSEGLHAYAIDSPTRWRHVGLLDGLPRLSDPVFISRDATWWVIGTAGSVDGERVHVYRAGDFWGPWTACAAPQPSCFRRRSAGPVVTVGNRPIRPTQDTFDHYGAAIHLNEITAIGPEGLAERHIVRIAAPDSWEFPYGLHTISGTDALTAIDACRRVTSGLALPQKLSGRIRRRRV